MTKVNSDYQVPFEMGQAACSGTLLEDLGVLHECNVRAWLMFVRAELDCHWKLLGTEQSLRVCARYCR